MKTIKVLSTLFVLMLLPLAANAVPNLQIDCDSCEWVGGTEQSSITTETVFEIVVIGHEEGTDDGEGGTVFNDLAGQFYLVVALTGDLPVGTGADGETLADYLSIGSIVVGGITYSASDFVWGTPPGTDENPQLGGHSIFDGWYIEALFTFDSGETCDTYDVQTGGSFSVGGSTCVTFDVDMSGLDEGFDLHFDVYELESDGSRGIFAPFSHDAGTSVPEPGTLSLLGLGLLALGLGRRRREIA